VVSFLLLFLSPTILIAKPVFIIVDTALAVAAAGAIGAGAVAAVGSVGAAAGAGTAAAAGVMGAGAAAAGAAATGAAAALAPFGAAAVAAAPTVLLGKALVGSGFLIGASAASKDILSRHFVCILYFRFDSATAAGMKMFVELMSAHEKDYFK
jgi:hypothetical protein